MSLVGATLVVARVGQLGTVHHTKTGDHKGRPYDARGARLLDGEDVAVREVAPTTPGELGLVGGRVAGGAGFNVGFVALALSTLHEMNRNTAPSATFINNFRVSNLRHKLLNILQLNGGTMSVGDLMRENSDPHDVTVYTITDFLREGLLEQELAPADGARQDEATEDPAMGFRLMPDERICLTDSGKLALENSA